MIATPEVRTRLNPQFDLPVSDSSDGRTPPYAWERQHAPGIESGIAGRQDMA